MSDFITDKIAVVAVTHRDCRIWAVDKSTSSKPELVLNTPDDQKRNHYRQVQRNAHHDTDEFDRPYLEQISNQIADASQILLIGHGHGKANQMLKLVQYLERYHPLTAKKVVGAEDAPLEALTDTQVLEFARKWFAEPVHTN